MYANVMRHTILHLTLIKKTVLCMLSFGVKAKSASLLWFKVTPSEMQN